MTPDDDTGDELTTLTFTNKERAMLAHALTVCASMVEALGDDADGLLRLWERVFPEEVRS